MRLCFVFLDECFIIISVLFHLVEMPVDKHTYFLTNKMQAASFVIH